MSFGFDGERHFNEKNTTLSGGFGLSIDELTPTDADIYPTRPELKHKQSYTGYLGLSQVMSRRFILQGNFTYNMHFGYLSDPYKEVKLVGAVNDLLGDFRPNMRQQFAMGSARQPAPRRDRGDDPLELPVLPRYLGHQLAPVRAVLVPDLRRLAADHADRPLLLAERRRLLRSLPEEERPDFVQPDDFSSDYRLSPYGSLSFGVKGEYTFHTPWWRDIEWRGRLSVERYLSSGDLCAHQRLRPRAGPGQLHGLLARPHGRVLASMLGRYSFRAMGSPCELQLHGPSRAAIDAVADAARALVERLEQKYSRYRDDSVLSAINRSAGDPEGVAVDDETALLLDYAATAHAQSDGLFDATSGSLRRVWNLVRAACPRRPRSRRSSSRSAGTGCAGRGRASRCPSPGWSSTSAAS